MEDQSAVGIDALVVSYTVKELLSQINESVTRIDTKLDTKASVEYVEGVERITQQNADRISALELAKAKMYGAAACLSFLAGGGGYLLASFANNAPT